MKAHVCEGQHQPNLFSSLRGKPGADALGEIGFRLAAASRQAAEFAKAPDLIQTLHFAKR